MPRVNTVLVTDCGSTTTKAVLIERKGDVYRQTCRGEAPTTVEAPFEDVTRGVLNAVAEVEELSGRTILDGERFRTPSQGDDGIDLYLSTSSAGGGLQMMVAGAVKNMTGESAQRCALGAGAIVMDTLASNDGRQPHEKIDRIRALRPDMMLLSGGTDGGTVTHVVELAEYIAAADPKPRLGLGYRLPLIYAGNVNAREQVERVLGDKMALSLADNLRPSLDRENLGPARAKIHDLFLEHVMAQAPGYKTLMGWTGAAIMPTPAAVGMMMQSLAKRHRVNVVGVDIGGATTDVFSVFDGVFHRTVSANLGMSYSISNVLAEAGVENILRWIPFDVPEPDLRNRIKNKMIRPTTIPHTLQELHIEQAIAREALRLAMDHHKTLATGLKGVQQERSISDVFQQHAAGASLIDMRRLDVIVGSGGILSHAPRRIQSMIMMVDAYEPVGITELAVDSIFMMPHVGVLSTVNEQAATDVFVHDCVIPLGTCVAPLGRGTVNDPCLDYEVRGVAQRRLDAGSVKWGDILLRPSVEWDEAYVTLTPAKNVDLGLGKGERIKRELRSGVVGLMIDCRGRPLELAAGQAGRIEMLTRWDRMLGLYTTSAA